MHYFENITDVHKVLEELIPISIIIGGEQNVSMLFRAEAWAVERIQIHPSQIRIHAECESAYHDIKVWAILDSSGNPVYGSDNLKTHVEEILKVDRVKVMGIYVDEKMRETAWINTSLLVDAEKWKNAMVQPNEVTIMLPFFGDAPLPSVISADSRLIYVVAALMKEHLDGPRSLVESILDEQNF